MKFFFKLKNMLAMTFCMHDKTTTATVATRAKIISIVYICGQRFHISVITYEQLIVKSYVIH